MYVDQPEILLFAASKFPFDACFGATLLLFFFSKDYIGICVQN
jgi:hypothetical protein